MHFNVYLFLVSLYVTCSYQDDRKKPHETYCQKWKKCVPDKKKVCGHDKEAMFMLVFNNLCLIYQTNCKKMGLFDQVDMFLCDTENEFMLAYNDLLTFPPYPKTKKKKIDIPLLEFKNKIEERNKIRRRVPKEEVASFEMFQKIPLV